MEERLRDPQMLREVLLRRTLRAMITAAGTLNRVARGTKFRSDEERWACLGLIRLASTLIGPKHLPPEEPLHNLAHPDNTEGESAVLLEILEKDEPFTSREESAQWWLEQFRKHGPFKKSYATEEQALEHGRREWDMWEEKHQRDLAAQQPWAIKEEEKRNQRRQKLAQSAGE